MKITEEHKLDAMRGFNGLESIRVWKLAFPALWAFKLIAKELRNGSAQKAFDNAQLLGFCAQAETINGRFAMFFFVTGLATELFTGQSVPQQIDTMLQVVGFINPGA
jgi:hypothetical protein